MFKEKITILEKPADIFSKKFRNHIVDTIKSKKQTKEIFTEHKKPFLFHPSQATRKS